MTGTGLSRGRRIGALSPAASKEAKREQSRSRRRAAKKAIRQGGCPKQDSPNDGEYRW